MSRPTIRLSLRPSGTSPRTMRCGEALDDGGLADAGLADEHRVVLRPAREHLDDAADLLVAADHRVELALARQLGQVAAVPLERLVLALGVLVGHALRCRGPPSAPRARASRVTPRCGEQAGGGGSGPSRRRAPSSRCSVLTYSSFMRAASASAPRRARPTAAARAPARRRRSACGSAPAPGARRRRDARRIDAQLAQHLGDDAVRLLDERDSRCSGSTCGWFDWLASSCARDQRLLGLLGESCSMFMVVSSRRAGSLSGFASAS